VTSSLGFPETFLPCFLFNYHEMPEHIFCAEICRGLRLQMTMVLPFPCVKQNHVWSRDSWAEWPWLLCRNREVSDYKFDQDVINTLNFLLKFQG
jgi:hypothetical protein